MKTRALFIEEVARFGNASPETARRLAAEMKSCKKPGRPRKTNRDFMMFAWYLVATRCKRWKSNTAFSELSARFGIDDRNARKAVAKTRKQMFMCQIYTVEYEFGAVDSLVYVFTKDVFSTCWVSVPDYAPGDMRLEGLVKGKNVHFFCFDKSVF